MIEKGESVEIRCDDTCWTEAFVNMERDRHIVPLGDIFPHLHSMGCWCGPINHGDAITHNAFDLREYFEVEGTVC